MEFGVRTQKRMLRRALAATVTLLVAAASVACTTPAPKPTPTLTAIFASEGEALAAATDTYQQFLAAYESASATGADVPAAVASFVSEAYLAEVSAPDIVSKNGWHTEGSSSFDVKGVRSFQTDAIAVEIVVELCRDVSSLRFVDADGTDVTPVERLDVVPLEVAFATDSLGSNALKITGVGTWQDDRCSAS
jgi:hypothetical protein